MNTFKEEFNNYISERISDNLVHLQKKKDYKEIYLKYKNLLDKIKKDISKEQQKNIDTLVSLLNILSDYELTTSYSIGFQDGIELKKVNKYK